MKPFARLFGNLFERGAEHDDSARRRQIHREWDRQRARALTPSDRAEIDAIFSRHL